MTQPTAPMIEDDEAERLALEAAVAEARADTRPATPHATVREMLFRDAERAQQRITRAGR